MSDTRPDPSSSYHSRLVTRIASRWRGKLPVTLSWAEMLQEGEVALAEARQEFDEARGVRFSTFAWGRIYHHLESVIRRTIEASQVVSLGRDHPDRLNNSDVEEVADMVWEEVERLDPFDREAVIRRWGLDGHGEESQRSTAMSMGVSPKKIAGSVRRSLSSMRERLAGDVA